MHPTRGSASLGLLLVLAGCADAVRPNADADASLSPDVAADAVAVDHAPIIDTSIWSDDVPPDEYRGPTPTRCGRSQAADVSIRAVLYDAGPIGCGEEGLPSAGGSHPLDGVITRVDSNAFTIDTCGPSADCAGPYLNTFTVTAPGLSLAGLRVGAYVHVSIQIIQGFGCTETLVVTNLPSWVGAPNPVETGTNLYLAAESGNTTIDPSAQLRIDRVALHCPAYRDAGCDGPADDFALHFTLANIGADTTLDMGSETVLPSVGPVSVRYRVSNLRSYVSGACDDDSNWDWFVVREP